MPQTPKLPKNKRIFLFKIINTDYYSSIALQLSIGSFEGFKFYANLHCIIKVEIFGKISIFAVWSHVLFHVLYKCMYINEVKYLYCIVLYEERLLSKFSELQLLIQRNFTSAVTKGE